MIHGGRGEVAQQLTLRGGDAADTRPEGKICTWIVGNALGSMRERSEIFIKLAYDICRLNISVLLHIVDEIPEAFYATITSCLAINEDSLEDGGY